MSDPQVGDRNAAIVKARVRGHTWPQISREFGVSERHARRVYGAQDRAAILRADAELEDDVHRVLRGLGADSERHRRRAAATRNRGAELAALRGNFIALRGRIDMLDRVGLLRKEGTPGPAPRPLLGPLREELLARKTAAQQRAARDIRLR